MRKAALFLIVLAACGKAAVPSAQNSSTPSAPSPIVGSGGVITPSRVTLSPYKGRISPSPTPTYTGSRTLHESDSGATVVLSVGETVRVQLGSDYDPPTASSSSVVRTSSNGGYPTGQPVDATFRASSQGHADIRSTTDYGCLHSHPACAIAQREWFVHITVS
ncbi:MAG: hypothetical protein ACYDCC_02960 [Actinomycetota bacterium]